MSLEEYIEERCSVHLQILDELALQMLLLNSDYMAVRFSKKYVSMIPMENEFPEYFEKLLLI